MKTKINGIPKKTYLARQRAALARLRVIGEDKNAQDWIHRNRPPPDWGGTPLEYAELEMPIGLFGAFCRFTRILW